MLGVNGWKQSLLSGAPVIDATNLASSSGANYNQDFSSLVTVNNITSVYETAGLTDEQVNTLLTEIVEGAASKVLNAVFSDDDFIENEILYPYEYDFQHTLENDTSFVGYEITTPTNKEILNILNKITLTFDAVDTVKILLFHSSKKSPVKSIEIATELDNEVSQELTDWILPYVNSVNGGKWYIGYLRSGLTAKAYDRDFENAIIKNNLYCSYFKSIQVPGHNTETLFDVNLIDYTSETYGLNFDISAYKNYDSIVLQNKNKFSKALGLQVAANVLDMIVNSNRSNTIERATKDNAIIQLNGFVSENVKTVGILAKLEKEIKNLKQSFLELPRMITNTLK
ncbi:hypothetical protein RPMD05_77 [Rhodobacteraceae phage LS06-2018-MD05]|nr:hypothetical protein RPMD05_77 [Rhodobacteraceae phage LS06-2018-MD05]